MPTLKTETLPLRGPSDVVQVRQVVRAWSTEAGFGLVDQTKLVTAASELARNTIDYGKGGHATMEALRDDRRMGLRITFEDQGPGGGDIAQALKDGQVSEGLDARQVDGSC